MYLVSVLILFVVRLYANVVCRWGRYDSGGAPLIEKRVCGQIDLYIVGKEYLLFVSVFK